MTASIESWSADSLRNWVATLQRHPRAVVATSLVFATVVAVADYATGDRFPLLFCYLPSVMVVCCVARLATCASLAAICCTNWLIDDLVGLGGETLTAEECWAALMHAMYFAVVVGVLRRLRQAYERERLLSRTDGLTGLLNAKAFRERADEEILRSGRTGRPVSAIFFDCDNFKTVNDTLGHLEGDRLLTAIAEQMRESVRATDFPARMGGDEFAILLPQTSEEEARQVVDRLRAALGDRMRQENWPVTFSIGVAVYASPPESVDELLHSADTLMYEVKSGRKNGVLLRLVA